MKGFFFLLLALVLFYVVLIYLPVGDIKETFSGDTSLRGKPEHLELAYQWCSSGTDEAPRGICDKFLYHYDSLNSTFDKLKNHHCSRNPKSCKDIGLV